MNMQKSNKGLAAFLLLMLAMVAGPALATTPAPTFDTSGILADIAMYLAGGIALLGAYIAGRWGLRAMGLLKPN